MPSITIKGFSGIYTAPNPFSHTPEGALLIADECIQREGGVLSSRPGFSSSVAFTADRSFPLPTTSKALCFSRSATDPTLFDPDANTSTGLTPSSGLSAQLPAGTPFQNDARCSIWAAQAKGSTYFTTPTGIGVVPGVSSPKWRHAGLPRPLASASAAAGPPTPLPASTRRTYRVTLAMYDELGNFLESAPSDPVWVETAGAAGLPVVTCLTPPACPAGAFFRVWRSVESPAGTIGSDEMFLLGTLALPAGTDANGFANCYSANNFTDITPTDAGGSSVFLSVPLYTNALTGDGQGGISAANERPPAASCVAWFKGRMYYGRCVQRQNATIQVIGTGTGGMVSGDTLIVDGVTYTANTALPGFVLYTGGTVTQNIENTARSIVVNGLYAYYRTDGSYPGRLLPITKQIFARYVSLGGTDWGRIRFERPFPSYTGDSPLIGFSVSSASAGIAFPNGTGTAADYYTPGSVMWSKPNQPEAVPLVNFQALGDPTACVLGFSVHRDTLFVWKEDGVYTATDNGGPSPEFAQLDASVVCVAPASIAVVDNLGYALTTRGVLQVSEQGTIPMSEPIHDDVIQRLDMSPNRLAQAFGIGYDAGRSYILSLGSEQYVLRVPDPGYPPSPPEWTRWNLSGTTHGMVLPLTSSPTSGRLLFTYATTARGSNLLSAPLSGAYIERKGLAGSGNYVDYVGSIANPATTTASTLTFPQDVHLEIFPGDYLTFSLGEGNKIYWMRVLSVHPHSGLVTLDGSYPFTAGGTLGYYRAIQCHWRHLPLTGGEPTQEKLWDSVHLHFDYIDGDWLSMMINSNEQQQRPWSVVTMDPAASNLGGTVITTSPLPYPSLPLPGPGAGVDVTSIPCQRQTRDVVMRLDPGQAEARASRLGVEVTFAQALAHFRLTALSAEADEIKTRSTR